MVKKRRLGDLYVLGREFTVDDDTGDPVTVWLQKLNPLEHEKALRAASAAKAQILIGRNDEDSELWKAAYNDVSELGERELLEEYAISEDLAKVREAREAELQAEEEWASEEYLQGLFDAWNNGLSDEWIRDKGNEEAAKVKAELERFNEELERTMQAEAEKLKADIRELDEDTLRKRVIVRFIEMQAGLVWVREFRRMEIFFATRELDDHSVYYFKKKDEVENLDSRVFGQLASAFAELQVDVTEGKGSGVTLASSPPSEPSSEEATAAPSGPGAATQ